MANIVITHFSPFLFRGEYQSSVFYDGLIKGFIDEGHNILQIITSNILPSPWNGSNTPFTTAIKNKTLNKIKDFQPDLVISFNNSSVAGIELAVDCPIALWDADTVQFFNDKETIKNNIDRYHYMAFFEYGIKDYADSLGVAENKICRVPGATAIKAKAEEKQYNISFIGNPFFKSDKLISLLNKHPELTHLSPAEIEIKKRELDNILHAYGIGFHELKYHKTGDNRAALITHLLDMKPKVFGPRDWLKLSHLSSDYINTYDPRAVYSLAHNEKIYNRSIISISTNHTQNTEGYPWRNHDILGSSSVLLSEHRKELTQDFAKSVDLQTFQSPSEARDIAKKLLNDEKLRIDILAQQLEAIDHAFRWKHRLPLIHQLTGVDLTPVSGQKGTHELYNPKHQSSNHNVDLREIKKRLKKCIRLLRTGQPKKTKPSEKKNLSDATEYS
jgi:hypothetical protein